MPKKKDKNEFVEIQGIAELGTVTWSQFEAMRVLAEQGTKELFAFIKKYTRLIILLI